MEQCLLKDLHIELICSICNEICIDPVRPKIKSSVCNDIFCKVCLIKMFYHVQKPIDGYYNKWENIKCPMCKQEIDTRDFINIHNFFIEDKIIRKLILVLFNHDKEIISLSCRYNCGFQANDIKELEEHQNIINHMCHNKLVKCDNKKCSYLGKIGKEIFTHNQECLFSFFTCPFCLNTIIHTPENLKSHFKNYHKLPTINVFLS